MYSVTGRSVGRSDADDGGNTFRAGVGRQLEKELLTERSREITSPDDITSTPPHQEALAPPGKLLPSTPVYTSVRHGPKLTWHLLAATGNVRFFVFLFPPLVE
jgi:hypothetical protein